MHELTQRLTEVTSSRDEATSSRDEALALCEQRAAEAKQRAAEAEQQAAAATQAKAENQTLVEKQEKLERQLKNARQVKNNCSVSSFPKAIFACSTDLILVFVLVSLRGCSARRPYRPFSSARAHHPWSSETRRRVRYQLLLPSCIRKPPLP